MSNTFNPEIIVHNGEGLTLTARPSQSIFAGTNGDVDLELKFKNGDIDGNNEVKYKNAEIGRNEISDDVFLRTKTPMIVEPLDGSDEWEGYTKVKVEISDDIKAGSSLEIQVSTDNTFNGVDLQQTIDFDNPEYQFDTSSLGPSSRVYIKCNIILPNGIKLSSSAVCVTNSRFYFAKNKQDLIRVLNNDIYHPSIIDTSRIEDLDYFWVSLNEAAKRNLSSFGVPDWIRFNFKNIKSMKYAFGYPDDGYMGVINTTIPNESDFGAFGPVPFINNIKTDNVTNMEGLFNLSKKFKLDFNNNEETISSWNVDQVTTLRKAFNYVGYEGTVSDGYYGVELFENLYFWSMKSVTDLYSAFSNVKANNFELSRAKTINPSGVPTGRNNMDTANEYYAMYCWDLSELTNMEKTFYKSAGVPFVMYKRSLKVETLKNCYHGSKIDFYGVTFNGYNDQEYTVNLSSLVNMEKYMYRAYTLRSANEYVANICNYNIPNVENMRGSFYMYSGKFWIVNDELNNLVNADYAFAFFSDRLYYSQSAYRTFPFKSLSGSGTSKRTCTFTANKLESADFMFASIGIEYDVNLTLNVPSLKNSRYMFTNFYSFTSTTQRTAEITINGGNLEDIEGMFSYINTNGHTEKCLVSYELDPGDGSPNFNDGTGIAAYKDTFILDWLKGEPSYGTGVIIDNPEMYKTKYSYGADYYGSEKCCVILKFMKGLNNNPKLRVMKSLFAGRQDGYSSNTIYFSKPFFPQSVEDISFMFFIGSGKRWSPANGNTCQEGINLLLDGTTNLPNLKNISYLFGDQGITIVNSLKVLTKFQTSIEYAAFFHNPLYLEQNQSPGPVLNAPNLKDLSGFLYNKNYSEVNFDNISIPSIERLDYAFANTTFYYGRSPFRNIENLNVSSVKYMRYTFEAQTNGTNTINLNTWDTSNVLDMEGIFNNNYQNLEISNWNVSKVENFRRAFLYKSRGTISSITTWDVSSVKNTEEMFMNAYRNFNQNISSWNVENVENSNKMFSGCSIQESYKPRKSDGTVLG